MAYMTLNNMPGYLPEAEPIQHSTWEQALEAWKADIADAMAELCECEEWTLDKLDQECQALTDALDLCDNLTERERQHGAWFSVNGRMYCIHYLP